MSPRESDCEETINLDEETLAVLYAEFGEQDRLIAEAGREDYLSGLKFENEQS